MAPFITLEGPDGAGKSIQAGLLAERVRGLGLEVVLVREPGGTPLGERIRTVLMDSPPGGHDALSDAFLFNAARSRLVRDVILPALDRGAVVIGDRHADSTLAYQGYGGGVPLDALRQLAAISIRNLVPDRTVLVDVPSEIGLDRRHGGAASEMTRFETAVAHGLEYHQRVRSGYLEMAAADPARWRVIDGRGAPAEVSERAWAAVADLFEGRPVTAG